jgi:tetratricopeptide (TPR) repeat protein
MSEATPTPEDPFQHDEPTPRAPGPLADPVVRAMTYALVGLIICVLATGVLTTTGPRSAIEQQLLTASAQSGGGAGEAQAPYITALIASGDLSAARLSLSQARASVGATMAVPRLDLAEARLFTAEKDYAKAVTFANTAMKGYKARFDARVKKGDKKAAAVGAAGYDEDYYNAALVKAFALVELRRWKDAVAAFDLFIRMNPTAADILIDRGNAKAELKDKAGAEKDFREALRFGPDNAEAKAGLTKIGVAK